jgi:ribosomal protein S18 acetylase RimI-like enzyme
MFSPLLPSLHSYWPFSLFGGGSATTMSVTYFKRYRMEIDLLRRTIASPCLPRGYRLVAWSPDLVDEHAATKYRSFRGEIDAGIFHSLSEPTGCYALMEGIAAGEGFVPEATWLVEAADEYGEREFCGTIQGVRANHRYGAIQNVGVVPTHRGKGVGAALVLAALLGFQQVGLPRAYLEVTVQNKGAVRLYQRLGFRRTKTLYKSVEMAYS